MAGYLRTMISIFLTTPMYRWRRRLFALLIASGWILVLLTYWRVLAEGVRVIF